MHKIEIFQIDAFTDKVFHGNPAAICLLQDWINDELLLAIARENGLSETAFLVESAPGFQIRWFTPKGELKLSGHSTLAAAFMIYEAKKYKGTAVEFFSASGTLRVERKDKCLTMRFPRMDIRPSQSSEMIEKILNCPFLTVYDSDLDYLVIMDNEQQILTAQVDLPQLAKCHRRGLIITAKSQGDVDFYSRCFYPRHNIPEDPVTGSAHCILATYWATQLNKTRLHGRQGLVRRGDVYCEVQNDAVYLSGYCHWYSKGMLVF